MKAAFCRCRKPFTAFLQGRAAAKPAFERLLTLAQEALHPMHVTVIDCLMPLVNCARATQDAPGAIRYLQQLLSAIETMYGCQTVEVCGYVYAYIDMLACNHSPPHDLHGEFVPVQRPRRSGGGTCILGVAQVPRSCSDMSVFCILVLSAA